jgi:hypothetical protein
MGRFVEGDLRPRTVQEGWDPGLANGGPETARKRPGSHRCSSWPWVASRNMTSSGLPPLTVAAKALLEPRLLADVELRPVVDPTRYGIQMSDALDHAHGTSDPAYAPAIMPRQLAGVSPSEAFDTDWLPEGHHWDLHIEHAPLESAGPFTGGGEGFVWHTTESDRDKVDLMWQVLRDKRAAPQVLIGMRPVLQHPVVKQCIPFSLAGRALAHPAGTPETNRANKTQVEVCGFTANVPDWGDWWYKALANLFVLISHRRNIPNESPQDFSHPRRMGGQEWVRSAGHIDHGMAPGNDHTDIYRLAEGKLMRFIDACPTAGYPL